MARTKEKTVFSFSDCIEILGNRKSKKVENNTWLEKIEDGIFAIRLHNTYIVKIFENDTYRIDNGDYWSDTTKRRINQFSPVNIWQEKHIWYFKNENGEKTEFQNGIVVEDGF